MNNLLKRIYHKLKNLKRPITVKSSVYGKIYLPNYNLRARFEEVENLPEVYNKNGEKMDWYFLRDMHLAHVPSKLLSEHFIFDRYNFGLPVHFYTHRSMLETMGVPRKRFGILCESEAIVPDDYKIFDKHKGLERDFDYIFTYSDKILNEISNAKFAPLIAAPWFISDNFELYKQKSKNISMLASKKILVPMHRFRYDLAYKCKNSCLADTYGTFDGGGYADLEAVLVPYRYTIILENTISDYYFTERLTNCFMSMTVPIYCGAKKIGDFFNADGIISFNSDDFDSFDKILSVCNEKDYESRIPAIIDNYKRVQKFRNTWDLTWEKYIKNCL